FLFASSADPHVLPPFPTRRSSDLGAICATGALDPFILFALLFIAAVLGDFVNYTVGSYVGLKIFTEDAKFFKMGYLEKTQAFFRSEEHTSELQSRENLVCRLLLEK